MQLFKAVQQIETKRRIALTGHPLMNKLDEYWTMVGWVRVPLSALQPPATATQSHSVYCAGSND